MIFCQKPNFLSKIQNILKNQNFSKKWYFVRNRNFLTKTNRNVTLDGKNFENLEILNFLSGHYEI